MSIVLESTKRVVEKSEHVRINDEKIIEIANQIASGEKKHWLDEAPFDISKLSESDRLAFIMILNSISFSYWGHPKWKINHRNKQIDGAYALVAALGNAISKGIPLTDFAFLSNLSEKDLLEILEGENKIPLFHERLSILRQLGTVIESDLKVTLINLIIEAKSVEELQKKLLEKFPFFRDESEYKGEKIYFYKRLQLLIADIFQTIDEARAAIGNIGELSACADYKLPQMLRKWGILQYSEELLDKIRRHQEIPSGAPTEVEIRANTIWAVEKIKGEISKTDPSISTVDVNDAIWLASQNTTPKDEPYHRTRTTSY